ncbi:hypothetical protein ACFVWP_03415 [Streptomyces sp. NPDC058175]|uniref:hypothetical protein n=1 Tax=Streptomyces sp. NPDC058175 TaxID=3346367 RepID=UPI0036EA0A18
MAEDQENDEVDAVVRIPKGERLADSRKSEGWSRGFTPKTSDKGPEHVEIRVKAEGGSGFADKPEIVYVTEYVEDQRPQLTPGQQAVADIAGQIIDGLVEIAKPLVAHWWHTQTVPFGNSSLLLGGGLARHHGLLEPCPGDRLTGVSGGTQASRGSGGAAAPEHDQGRGVAGTAPRERGAAQAAHEAGAIRAGGSDVVRSTVLADPPAPVGAGVPGDARDAAGVAP